MEKRTDYTKFSNEPNVAEIREETVETIKHKTGIVYGCHNLNIRKNPNPNSEIAAIIPCGTELMVYVEESTNEFYSICTATGIEGYCMKRYINLK